MRVTAKAADFDLAKAGVDTSARVGEGCAGPLKPSIRIFPRFAGPMVGLSTRWSARSPTSGPSFRRDTLAIWWSWRAIKSQSWRCGNYQSLGDRNGTFYSVGVWKIRGQCMRLTCFRGNRRLASASRANHLPSGVPDFRGTPFALLRIRSKPFSPRPLSNPRVRAPRASFVVQRFCLWSFFNPIACSTS